MENVEISQLERFLTKMIANKKSELDEYIINSPPKSALFNVAFGERMAYNHVLNKLSELYPQLEIKP